MREQPLIQKNSIDYFSMMRLHNSKGRRVQEMSQSAKVDLQNDQEWTQEEKEKLKQIFKQIELMKNQRRAHELVMNLPSRMIKSFNQKKFALLDDKSYIFDDKFFKESILYNNQFKGNERSDLVSPSFSEVKMKLQQITQSETLVDNKETKKKKKPIMKIMKRLLQNINKSSMNLKKSSKEMLMRSMRYFDSIPILLPSCVFKLIWDMINMVVLILCMFYLPIAVSFHITLTELLSKTFSFIIPLIFFIDILINMNTGYFDKGQVIKSRIKIISYFFKEKLIKELVCIIPLLILIFNSQYKDSSSTQLTNSTFQHIFDLSQMVFYMKVFTLSSILWKIEERFNLSGKYLHILQLVKLLFTILLINHLFACLWVYVAKLEIEAGYEITWMSYENIRLKDWSGQYLSAFYFTTVTMITVGYGDILPKNDLEMVLCVATMMLACGVFGYSINEIGFICNNIFYVDNQIKKQISQIQRFMSKKNINTKLQYQIREYLEYYLREQAEMNQEQEQQIIEQLSESLRSKLLFEANKIVLKDSPIFKQNFSKAVIEQTVPLIKEIKFSPESFIFLKGIQDDGAIYFIENGSVEIVLDQKNKRNKTLFQLNKGDSFGAHSFFTGFPRINFIRSKEFTTVLKIGRQEFLNLIQRFPEDYETFCSIRDSINYLNDYSRIGLNCVSCGSNYHMVNECQYIHYIPKKARIIKYYKDQFNIDNANRNPHKRRNVNQYFYFKKSLIIQKEVSQQIEIFIDLNQSLMDYSENEESFSDGYFGNENSILSQNKKPNQKIEQEQIYQNVLAPVQKGKGSYVDVRNQIGTPLNNSSTYIQINEIENEKKVSASLINHPSPSMSKLKQFYDFNNELQNENEKKNSNSVNSHSPAARSKLSYFNDYSNEQQNLNRIQSKLQFDKQWSLRHQQSFDFSEKQSDASHMNYIATPGQDNQPNSQSQMHPDSTLQLSINRNQDDSNKNIQRSKSFQYNQQSNHKNQFKLRHNNSSQLSETSISQENIANVRGKATLAKQTTNENQKQKIQSITQLKDDVLINQNLVQSLQKFISLISNQIEKQKYSQNQELMQPQQFHTLQQHQSELDNDEITMDFDRMKQFVKYKPKFNYSTIISRFNQLQDQKRKANRRHLRNQKKNQSFMIKSQYKLNESERTIDPRKNSKHFSYSPQNIKNFNTEHDLSSSKFQILSKYQENDLDSKEVSVHLRKQDNTINIEKQQQNNLLNLTLDNNRNQILQNVDLDDNSIEIIQVSQKKNTTGSKLIDDQIFIEQAFEDENKLTTLPYETNKNKSNIQQRSLHDQ